MSAAPTEHLHPVARAVAEATSALREAIGLPLFGLGGAELRELCRQLTSLASTLTSLDGAALAQAESCDVAAEVGATSTANWLAHEMKLTRKEAHRRVKLARDLETFPATSAALAAGEVVAEQAGVICHAVARLDKIPADLVADRDLDLCALKAHAEQHLLAEAAHHDAKGLQILGRHLLDVIAPEVAEEHERRLLEQEEERARQKTRFTMTEDGQGCVHGRFTLPALQASMLKKALLALAAPKHQAAVDGTTPVPGRPSAERMGQAFAEYVERYPADRIPDAGGVPASLVITMDLEKLLRGLGAGVLDDGGRISATEARRLACEAGIIPAVLGGRASRSTWGGRSGSTPPPSASRWRSATVVAPPRAATTRPVSVTPTTTSPGEATATPTSRTDDSSARDITPWHTTRVTTPPDSAPGSSASPDARRATRPRRLLTPTHTPWAPLRPPLQPEQDAPRPARPRGPRRRAFAVRRSRPIQRGDRM